MKNPHQESTLPPLKKEELLGLVGAEIKKNGNRCDLNHIDVSRVTNFSFLFAHSGFNGDISNWFRGCFLSILFLVGLTALHVFCCVFMCDIPNKYETI